MTGSKSILRLGQVATVRRIRLTRAAEDARLASEIASREAARADTAKTRADDVLRDARSMFVTAPGCEQARFWVELASERRRARIDEADTARGEADMADQARIATLQAVVRHQWRSDAIVDHGRRIARAEQRILENRADDERSER